MPRDHVGSIVTQTGPQTRTKTGVKTGASTSRLGAASAVAFGRAAWEDRVRPARRLRPAARPSRGGEVPPARAHAVAAAGHPPNAPARFDQRAVLPASRAEPD